MTRILLIFVVPFFVPTTAFILWRTYAPIRWGGSEAIARDRWEPLPWKPLLISGGVLTAITVMFTILFPEFFGGEELAGSPARSGPDR
jgi:hypothetical protein